MYAVQKGITLDSKSPEAKKFLFGLMDNLETVRNFKDIELKAYKNNYCCDEYSVDTVDGLSLKL